MCTLEEVELFVPDEKLEDLTVALDIKDCKVIICILEECIEIQRQKNTVRDEEYDVAISTLMRGLAIYLHKDDRVDEAIQVARDCFELRRKGMGKCHLDTLLIQHDLAFYLGGTNDLSKNKEAVELAKDCLTSRRKILGLDNKDTLSTHHEYAYYLSNVGKVDEAIIVASECLSLCQQAFGSDSDQTLCTQHELACNYSFAGQYTKAIELMEGCFAVRNRTLGKDHQETILAHSNLMILVDDCLKAVDSNKKETKVQLPVLDRYSESFIICLAMDLQKNKKHFLHFNQ